jgi:hypothetical protein
MPPLLGQYSVKHPGRFFLFSFFSHDTQQVSTGYHGEKVKKEARYFGKRNTHRCKHFVYQNTSGKYSEREDPLILVSQITLKEPAVFTKNQQFIKVYLTSS